MDNQTNSYIKFQVQLEDEANAKVYGLMLKMLMRLKGTSYVAIDKGSSKIRFYNSSFTMLSMSPFDIEIIENTGDMDKTVFSLNAEAVKSLFIPGAQIKLYYDCIKSSSAYISSSLALDNTSSTVELKESIKEIDDIQNGFADADCLFESKDTDTSLVLSILSTSFAANKSTIIQLSNDGLLAFCGGIYLIDKPFDSLQENGDILKLKSNSSVYFLNEFISSIVSSYIGIFDKVSIRFANKKVQIKGETGDLFMSIVNSDMQETYGDEPIISQDDLEGLTPTGSTILTEFADSNELINGVQSASQSLNEIGISKLNDKATWFLLETSGLPALKVLQSDNSSSEIIVNFSDKEIDVKSSHAFTPFAVQIPVAIVKALASKDGCKVSLSYTNNADDSSSAVVVNIDNSQSTKFFLSKKFI